MKQKHIFVFFISLLANIHLGYTQTEVEKTVPETKDTTQTSTTKYYGLRIGADISKPIRSLLSPEYSGFEIVGDFRIKKNYYLAAEVGNETRTSVLTNINSTSQGSYVKAGVNYNVYENWVGMNNLIYVGGRAGFSSFSEELNSYTIRTTNTLFGDDTRTESREFDGLNSTWLELLFGLQTEVLSNLYLGIQAQLKYSITRTEPDGFTNIFIPGFGETTDGSQFGVGYGYTISYLIPFVKK